MIRALGVFVLLSAARPPGTEARPDRVWGADQQSLPTEQLCVEKEAYLSRFCTVCAARLCFTQFEQFLCVYQA